MRRSKDVLRAGAVAALLACQGPLTAGAQMPVPRAVTAGRQNAAAAVDDATRDDESFAALQRRLAQELRRGDLAAALELAERQRELFPDEMKATADLAEVHLRRGAVDRAEPLLREALGQRAAEYDGDAAALRGALHAQLGQIALSRGRADEAITHLQRAIDLAPTAARARFLLASAFAAKGDVERSDRELRAAFDVDRSAAGPRDYAMLGAALRRAGEAAEAAEVLAGAVKAAPLDADTRLELAAALEESRRPAAALYELLYTQMLLHARAPQAAVVVKQIERIRAAVEAADEPDPETEAVFAYLDDASTDQHEQALQSIHEAIRLHRGSGFVPNLLLARSYKATGRYGEAERIFVQLIESDPHAVPAMVELADLYFAQGRRERARRYLERAAAVDARNPRVLELTEASKSEIRAASDE